MYSEDEEYDGEYGSEQSETEDNQFANDYLEYKQQHKQQYTDAYKDFGDEGRFGMAQDEDLNINIIDTKYGAKLSDRDIFALEVKKLIDTYKNRLSDVDKKVIKQNIDNIFFVRFRDPHAYVMSYIMRIYPKFNVGTISNNRLFNILKYGHLWGQVL